MIGYQLYGPSLNVMFWFYIPQMAQLLRAVHAHPWILSNSDYFGYSLYFGYSPELPISDTHFDTFIILQFLLLSRMVIMDR